MTQNEQESNNSSAIAPDIERSAAGDPSTTCEESVEPPDETLTFRQVAAGVTTVPCGQPRNAFRIDPVGTEPAGDAGPYAVCAEHRRGPYPEPACGVLDPHGLHDLGAGGGVCLGSYVDGPLDSLGSYAGMFSEYLQAQRHWIGPAQQPLVFHIKKLCRRLDVDDDAPASYSSAYLQAISRLDKQRPGNKQPAGSDGDLPGQRSIFDEMDD